MIKKIDAFFQDCKTNNHKKALTELVKNTPINDKIFGDEATLKNFLNQLSNLNEFYGELLSYEQVKEKKIGKISDYIYFFYHHDYISRFNFTYYNRDDSEPLLIYFTFDDQPLKEF